MTTTITTPPPPAWTIVRKTLPTILPLLPRTKFFPQYPKREATRPCSSTPHLLPPAKHEHYLLPPVRLSRQSLCYCLSPYPPSLRPRRPPPRLFTSLFHTSFSAFCFSASSISCRRSKSSVFSIMAVACSFSQKALSPSLNDLFSNSFDDQFPAAIALGSSSPGATTTGSAHSQ